MHISNYRYNMRYWFDRAANPSGEWDRKYARQNFKACFETIERLVHILHCNL